MILNDKQRDQLLKLGLYAQHRHGRGLPAPKPEPGAISTPSRRLDQVYASLDARCTARPNQFPGEFGKRVRSLAVVD